MNNLLNKLFKSKLFHIILFILILGLGIAIIAIPLFRTTALPGPDSPYYLYHTEKLLSNPHYSLPRDRSFVIQTFAFINKATHFSTINAIKIGVTILYLFAGVATYLITHLLFNNIYIALLSMFLTYFSSALLRLSWDLYANLYGAVLLYILIYLLLLNTKNSWSKWWQTLIFFLTWGVLFRVHGLVSIASLGIIGIPLLFSLFGILRKSHQLKHLLISLLLGISIFFIVGGPILKDSYLYIYRGVILPRFSRDYALTHKKVGAWTANVKKVSYRDLPLYKNMFINFYSPRLFFLDFWGLIYLSYELLKKPRYNKNYLTGELFIFFSFLLFSLTQQQIFGINWLSDRFVLSMYGVIAILGSYGLSEISKTIISYKSQKIIQQVSSLMRVLLIVLVTTLTVYSPTKRAIAFSRYSMNPTLSEKELKFIKGISKHISKKQYPVISTSLRHYWVQALNPDIKFIPAEYYAICNDKGQKYRFNNNVWLRGRAFGTMDYLESLKILRDQLGQHYYVIISKKDRCVNENNFIDRKHYKAIFVDDIFYILERQ